MFEFDCFLERGLNMVKENKTNPMIHIFFILFCLLFIVPLYFVLIVSLTPENHLQSMGFRFIPESIGIMAYRYVFSNPQSMIDAYAVTSAQAFLGAILSVLIMALCAYALSRRNYLFRRHVTYYIFFTMLFGGGLIPSYIINTQYLKMGNTFWIYIFPGLANAFTIIIIRTFFQGLPESLVESAKMDGASELRIFFSIMLPLSKPVIATFLLFGVLDRWNNWATSLIYIREQRLYTLQFLLQRILMEAEFIKSIALEYPSMADKTAMDAPTESMRFALAVVAIGPALVIFPFFQKYFSKGLTIGSVKG